MSIAQNMNVGLDAGRADSRMPTHRVLRQTQVLIGTIVVASAALGAFWNPWALVGAAFIGGGLVFAGLSGTCGMATVLAKLPWNQGAGNCPSCRG